MKKVFLFICLLSIIFLVLILYPFVEKETYISIEKGKSISQIAKDLKDKKLIISKDIFKLYFVLFNRTPKAGFYKIEKNGSLLDIVIKLSSGKQDLVKVVIIPGDDLFKVAGKLEKAEVIKKKNFLNFFNNKFKLLSMGFIYDSFEGFIVPDTYFLEKSLSPKRLFDIFYQKFTNTYHLTNKDFYDYMIIASLIEKEAKTKNDKYLISSVIHNRLKKNMPLQIDATLIYLAKKLKIKYISIKELKNINSPYNTYKNSGLPPTPICNFSKESLDAALKPAKTEYLFYFTKDGKKHIFSKTYKEHLKKLNSKW